MQHILEALAKTGLQHPNFQVRSLVACQGSMVKAHGPFRLTVVDQGNGLLLVYDIFLAT